MKCLIVGSSRFIAPPLVEELLQQEAEVALLDNAELAPELVGKVTQICADKSSLAFFRDECLEFKPDVAIHLSANSSEDASGFLEVFQGQVANLVVTSNTNVYLAHARLRKTEPGASLAVPINENSPLRELPLNEGESGDKRDVEAIFRASTDPTTLLRVGPVYGPNDYLRRFYPLLVRMIDDRPFIFLGRSQAEWKWSHCYVDNLARAIALSALNPGESHRIYNVGESKTPTMKERIEQLGTVTEWDGVVKVVADDSLPDYLVAEGDFVQDMEIDSSLIRTELGFKEVVDYYDGLAKAAEWYTAHPPAHLAGKRFSYAAEDRLYRGNAIV